MWRLVVCVLLLAAVAPLIPEYVVPALEARHSGGGDRTVAEDEGAARVHRIPVSRNGQYVTEGRLNGRTVTMLVDTGASKLAIPEAVANQIGIFLQPSDFNQPVRTANGRTFGAAARVRDFRLGPIRLKDVDAIVMKDGRLGVPLLGMSALGRLDRFDISDDTLVLVQ